MWPKSVARIEAILVPCFIALLVRALVEREIRRRMREEDLAALPLYPEDRDCAAPTARQGSAEPIPVRAGSGWPAAPRRRTRRPVTRR